MAFALLNCSGGGGGNNINIPTSPIYYSEPVKVHSFDPSVKIDSSAVVYDSFIDNNITGSGVDVVLAGRETTTSDISTHSDTKLQLLSWENGTLVDKTNEWFVNGENIIKGTEPSLHFTDFFKTGRSDMFIAHSTDMEYYGPSYVFKNTGSNFERIEISMNNVWAHGSDVGDINGDTYSDIAIVDYGPNTTLAINNTVDNFVTYTDVNGLNGDLRFGGSDIVIGDFDGDGSTEFIVTDNTCNSSSCVGPIKITRMYGYTIDSNNNLHFNYEADLPLPRLDLTDGSGVENHDVRIVAHDFNEDGIEDVIVFSRDQDYTNKISEIQFLLNDGSGNFSDVTTDTLIGYDTNTHSTYKPTFLDINNDGKTDILVSGGDYSGNNNSHQILFKSSDNKYVAAYQNILKDLFTDLESQTSKSSDGSTVNIFEAPNGQTYLITYMSYVPANQSDRVVDVFLSQLTDPNLTTVQNASDLLQSTWSYLSQEQINQALIDTSSSFHGGYVINLEQAMKPIGSLSINNLLLSGSLIAPGVSGEMFSDVTAVDDLGRDYSINLGSASKDKTILDFSTYIHKGQNLTSSIIATSDLPVFVLGNDHLNTMSYSGIAKSWQYTISKTYMADISPWLSMQGVWGEVTSSDTTELGLYKDIEDFWLQTGWINSNTKIQPGVISNVSPIQALYGMVGYSYTDSNNSIEISTGIEPMILSGNMTYYVPTSINANGDLIYSSGSIALDNGITNFFKIHHDWSITDNLSMISAAKYTGGDQNKITNLQMEIKYAF